LNIFKADAFEVDPLIIITSIHFQAYQVSAFTGTRSSKKFKYPYDFPSSLCYFTRLFLVTTWEVVPITFDIRFDIADIEGFVDNRKLAVC